MPADTAVATDLSKHTKRTFQVVGLIATVMVVGIHYKTDVPNTPFFVDATWNEVLQEYWLGGIARVAVPMFAFIAGLLYFRSDDGSFACYRKKFLQRCRTVLLPYFIIASCAMASWLVIRRLRSDPVEMGSIEFLTTWLLRPPAEQLWFLRDLIVLVAIAPIVRLATHRKIPRLASVAALLLAWAVNFQPLPIVAGWHLIHIETLLFFTLGCIAVSRVDWINRIVQWRCSIGFGLLAVWILLVAVRVWMRPDFDIWYVNDYMFPDLIVHQLSIAVGCVALLAITARLDSPRLQRWSGASFCVFLVHEFPLRAAVQLVVEKIADPAYSCWVVFPCVVIGCYAAALWTSKHFPVAFGILTGGRTPTRAVKLVGVTGRFTSTETTHEPAAS